MADKKILYDSDEAAKRVSVYGWLSADGMFWADKNDPKFAEHHARWGGCTHIICDCGEEYEKGWTMCKSCRKKESDNRYQKLEFKEWSGEPLCLWQDDTYFFSEDELIDWAYHNRIKDLSEIQLVICEPQYAEFVEPTDMFIDLLPEDTELEEVAPKLAAAIAEVNRVIREEPELLSWMGGKYRTTVNKTISIPEPETDDE